MLAVERAGCTAGTGGPVGQLPSVLGNLPLSRVVANLAPFSPLLYLSPAQSLRTCMDAGVHGASHSQRARADAGRHMCWAWLAAVLHMQFFNLHPQSVYNLWPKLHLLYGKIWPVERR